MRFRRRRGSDRRRQDNGRRNASGNGNFRPHNRGSPSASQGNSSGLTHATTPQQSRLTPLHPRVPSRGPPPHLQGNSSGLTHATTPQHSRLTPLHPRVRSRGPPPHLQGNSSGLTHATNVAAVPTHPPAPSSAHGPGLALTAPTMRYGPALSWSHQPERSAPRYVSGTTFSYPVPARRQCRVPLSTAPRHGYPPQLTPTHR